MKLKQNNRKGRFPVERVLATLFFIAALCLHAFFLRARGEKIVALYHMDPIPHRAAWELGLFCALAVWWAYPKGKGVRLTAVWKGKRLEIGLTDILRHLMVAASVLVLLFSVLCALPYVKSGPVEAVEAPPPASFPEDIPPEKGKEVPLPSSGPDILASTRVIAHALGALDSHSYLNCLEGFQEMYAQGTRVFEADMVLDGDGTVVLRHDWDIDIQEGIGVSALPGREGFLSTPILGQYTPLSFRDLLLLMEEYPDICIITDSKYADPEIALVEFKAMVEEAKELGLMRLFDRIIIQIYNPGMLNALDRAYHFPHYIFTLYQYGFEGTEEDFRKKAEFCATHRVRGITMWSRLWDPAYASIAWEYGIEVYVHTVNDLEEARERLDSGVSAIYTDTLTDALLYGT